MRKQDKLVRGILGDGRARLFVLRTTDLVNEAQRRHDTYPVATAALGRTLTATLVLGAMLKGEESVTVQVRGDGILQGVVTTADSKGHVRGYVGNPHVHLPLNSGGKLAVGEAVGQGMLFVIRDLGLRENYQGSVPLQTGEIAEDFAFYFAVSEQTPSVVSLGVLVNPDHSVQSAGGLVIQLLPGAENDEEFITALEKSVAQIPAISSVFADDMTPERLAEEYLGHLGLKFIAEGPVSYQCDCSKERFMQGLIALGEEELEGLIAHGETVETECRFCAEKYYYPLPELEDVLRELRLQKERD